MRLSGLLGLALVVVACGGASEGGTSSGTPDPGGSGEGPGNPSSSGSPPGQSSGQPGVDDAGSTTNNPATPSVRFVAMGDTGTGSNGQLKVGNTISAHCKARGCDFVTLLGDNIYDSGASSADDPIWQTHFETPYAAIDLDFYAALGNHDYGHGGAGTDFGKGKSQIDYTAKSKKWKMPSAYYHFAPKTGEGTVELFALDTNMAMFSRDGDQRKDMAGFIAASTAEWKIAFGHHPYKSNGPHGNAGKYDAKAGISLPIVNGEGVKDYLEDTICGKVDLYLSGHDHSRQWLNESCMGTELAVSGAGAKATELPGKNATLFQSLELGFLYVVIEGKKLTAEFIDENGQTEFTHTMTKP